MSIATQETVLSVRHWNDTLMSFTTTRDRGLRFKNGHFVMIGLEIEGKPLMRAFSFASANYEEHLEFYSIKVPDGPLTSRLQNIKPGDPILVGKRLYLLATGTGLAPFMSIIRDLETYERFEHVIVAHGVRTISELGYADYIRNELPQHELVGENVQKQLHYYPTVTREEFENTGRLTELLESSKLCTDLGLPALDAEHDRVMICGSNSMLTDLTKMLDSRGFKEGSSHEPAEYTIERAFVEK